MQVNLNGLICEMVVFGMKPGVAALVRVDVTLDGKRDEVCVVYTAGERQPELSPYDARRFGVTYAESLFDDPTMARINRHFGNVFSLPIEKREAYLKQILEV